MFIAQFFKAISLKKIRPVSLGAKEGKKVQKIVIKFKFLNNKRGGGVRLKTAVHYSFPPELAHWSRPILVPLLIKA